MHFFCLKVRVYRVYLQVSFQSDIECSDHMIAHLTPQRLQLFFKILNFSYRVRLCLYAHASQSETGLCAWKCKKPWSRPHIKGRLRWALDRLRVWGATDIWGLPKERKSINMLKDSHITQCKQLIWCCKLTWVPLVHCWRSVWCSRLSSSLIYSCRCWFFFSSCISVCS